MNGSTEILTKYSLSQTEQDMCPTCRAPWVKKTWLDFEPPVLSLTCTNEHVYHLYVIQNKLYPVSITEEDRQFFEQLRQELKDMGILDEEKKKNE